MAGIYIHIPFCRQLCHYCDFYRSRNIPLIPDYLDALTKEIELRRNYLNGEEIDTIYIGGGTPSLLSIKQINSVLSFIKEIHTVIPHCEITIEANPDDLSRSFLDQMKDDTPINRLSIGIQSFLDDDLLYLNRRHHADQSILCLENAVKSGFNNMNIDLIYGIPGLTVERWNENLQRIPFNIISHLSAYHLTIEPKTPLYKTMKKGGIQAADEEQSYMQYKLLCQITREKQFKHYEISNFCREGFHSRHNSGYWKQKKYLGLGPSAHSYDLNSRQWNVSDVKSYISALKKGELAFNAEQMNDTMRFNEYVMLSLRTILGANMEKIRSLYGELIADTFKKKASRFLDAGQMRCKNGIYTITEDSWFISDYVISNLLI